MIEYFENEYMNQSYKGKLVEIEYESKNHSGAKIVIQLEDSSTIVYKIDTEPNINFVSNVKINDSIIKTKGNDSLIVISKTTGVPKKYVFLPFTGGEEPYSAPSNPNP